MSFFTIKKSGDSQLFSTYNRGDVNWKPVLRKLVISQSFVLDVGIAAPAFLSGFVRNAFVKNRMEDKENPTINSKIPLLREICFFRKVSIFG